MEPCRRGHDQFANCLCVSRFSLIRSPTCTHRWRIESTMVTASFQSCFHDWLLASKTCLIDLPAGNSRHVRCMGVSKNQGPEYRSQIVGLLSGGRHKKDSHVIETAKVGAQPNTFGIPGVDKYGRPTRPPGNSGAKPRDWEPPRREVSQGDRARPAAAKGAEAYEPGLKLLVDFRALIKGLLGCIEGVLTMAHMEACR